MSIGDLATILTVAGVSIYVLGLIGLAIPIRREFTGDISTAWYAASLVPKTVVAGQGVRIWLQWTVGFTVLLLLFTEVLRSLFSKDTFFAVMQLTTVMFPLVLGGYGYFKTELPWIEIDRLYRSFALNVLAFAGLVAIIYVGLALTTTSLARLAYPEERYVPFEAPNVWHILYPAGSDPTAFRSLAILLIGCFFLALPFSIQASPPLPRVRIIKQPEATIEGVPEPLEGWLVAHSDGFWHLFAAEDQRDAAAQERWDLISIPDNNALVVRTFGKEDARAEAAPETDGQRSAEEARLETERGGEVSVSPPEHPE